MEQPLHIFDRLLEVTSILQNDMARSFESNGLTMSRTHLLWELNRLGATTQKALADALHVSPRNVTGLVDALEATGFVARAPHPTDRRATIVALTELGARTMQQMEADRLRLSEQLIDGMSGEQQRQLALGLDAVTERLHALVSADLAQREERQRA